MDKRKKYCVTEIFPTYATAAEKEAAEREACYLLVMAEERYQERVRAAKAAEQNTA